MITVNLPFWLRGPGLTKIKTATENFAAKVIDWLEFPLRQIDPAECEDALLELHAWPWDMEQMLDETRESFRDRIVYAYRDQVSSGSKKGLGESLSRVGEGFTTIEERVPGLDWDIVKITMPSGSLSQNQDLLLKIIQKFGRTCRRYFFAEFESVNINPQIAETGCEFTTEKVVFDLGFAAPVFGPELVSGGDMSGGLTDWTEQSATISAVDDSGDAAVLLSATGTGDRGGDFAIPPVVNGKVYRIAIKARQGAQGADQVFKNFDWCVVLEKSVSSGTYDLYVYKVFATATSGSVKVFAADANGAVGDELYISDISIKEITENHGL